MGEPLSPATVSVQRARALRRRMDERVRREGDRGMRVGRVSGLRIHSDRGLRKGEEKTGTLGGNGGGDWGIGARMEIEKAREKKGKALAGKLGARNVRKRNGPESPDEVPGALPSPVLTTQTPQRVAIRIEL